MKKIILALFTILTFSIVKADMPTHVTGYAYAPYKDRSQMNFYVFSMTGTLHTNGIISVNSVQYIKPLAISTGRMQAPVFFGYDLITQYYHLLEIPPTPIVMSATQAKMEAMTSSGVLYIGEPINELGNMVIPPEPLITHYPIAGEVIEGYSKVYQSYTSRDNIINPNWHWRYTTVGYFPTFGGRTDVWITSLREIVTGNDMIYNYTWKKDVGMVDYWYGTVNEQNNTVTGWLYYSYQYIEDVTQ